MRKAIPAPIELAERLTAWGASGDCLTNRSDEKYDQDPLPHSDFQDLIKFMSVIMSVRLGLCPQWAKPM